MKNFIFLLRQRLDMSQYAMARIIGVSQSTIAHWETGYRIPSGSHLQKIIKFAQKNGLKPTLDDLYPPSKRKGKMDKSKKKSEKEKG